MELENYAYHHILGGLYGQALGDAWSMPAYFRPGSTWAIYNGWIDTLIPAPADHPRYPGFQAGQITDDTQQALALAKTIIAGDFTVAGVARAVVDWYDEVDGDNLAWLGASTRRAVTALKSGTEPKLAGLTGDTSGVASRVIPIGLIHPGHVEVTVPAVVTACTPTHFTDVAISGAAAVAAAVAQAMKAETTLESIIDAAIWGADAGVRHGSPWLGASVARKIDLAVRLASETNLSERDRIQNLYDLIGSTAAMADVVPCAFGVLTLANGHPFQTAMYAAALSGNATSVGAIAGGIAGAWNSIDAIPVDYIDTLRQANATVDFEEIATGLLEVAQRNQTANPALDEDFLGDIL